MNSSGIDISPSPLTGEFAMGLGNTQPWAAQTAAIPKLAAAATKEVPVVVVTSVRERVDMLLIVTINGFEFIPIKSLVAKGSGAPGSYVGRSRCPSPDRGRPSSTGGSGL